MRGVRMLLPSVLRSSPVTTAVAVRALSTASPNKADVAKFAHQRKAYNEQLNELRKEWGQEFERREAETQQKKLVERVHIQLRQAERLREKRRISAIRAEEYQKLREEQEQRWREHVAKQQILWEASQVHRQQTYENLVKELASESKVWITDQSIEDKLSPELFGDACSSTGLFTRHSDYMRYNANVWNVKRPVPPTPESPIAIEDLPYRTMSERLDVMSISERLETLAAEYVAQRNQVSAFLEEIIDNGRDREQFHEVAQTLVDVLHNEGPDPDALDADDDEDSLWRDKGYYDEDVQVGSSKKERMQASKRLNARLLRQEAKRTDFALEEESDDEDVVVPLSDDEKL